MANKRNRPDKPWFLVSILAISVAVAVVVMSWFFMQNNQTDAKVSTRGTAPRGIQGGVGGKGTPEFNQKLRDKTEEEAAEAVQRNRTYVPPLINDTEDSLGQMLGMDGVETEQPPPLVNLNPPNVRPARQNSDVEQDGDLDSENTQRQAYLLKQQALQEQQSSVSAALDEYLTERATVIQSSILNTLSNVNQSMVLSPAQTTVYAAAANWPEVELETEIEDRLVKKEETERDINIYPGDVLYAVVDQFLTSDAPVPVFRSTIISGEYKGGILLGSFERVDESLVVNFERLRLPNNEIYDIEAYGVDPKATNGSLASSVNRHTISRWSAVIGASLLKGWGEAIEASDQGAVAVADTVVSTTPAYNFGEQALIASGAVGEIFTEKAIEYFDRPPTVKLRQGFPIGVVVLDIDK